jgi:hypothetical protein
LKSARTLLDSVLDYAGLFPPAALNMAEAVNNYARYCVGGLSWILGRFILPLSRMEEFETVVSRTPSKTQEGRSWRVSVLGTDNPEADLKQILEFNRRYSGNAGSDRIVVDAVELKVHSKEAIQRAAGILASHLQTYFEIAISQDTPCLIDSISERHGRAKVRTGGLVPDLFPSPEQLASFLFLCAGKGVPFKATAGLHHAFRSVHPLTYEKSSPLGMMHGFMNLLFASALAHAGADEKNVATVLSEEDPKSFYFDDGSILWHNRMINNVQLRSMRNGFFHSFGACSFLEPTSDIMELKLL